MEPKPYYEFDASDWEKVQADYLLIIIKDCYQTIKDPKRYQIEKIDAHRCLWEALQTEKQEELIAEIEKDGFLSRDEYQEFKKGFTFEWFRICRDTEDKDIAFYFDTRTVKGAPLNRECYVKRLIWEKGELSQFFQVNKSNKTAQLYLKFLVDWFLKRYDLLTARSVLKILRDGGKNQRDSPRSLKRIVRSFSPCIVFLMVLTLLIVIPITIHPNSSKISWYYERPFFYEISSTKVNAYYIYSYIPLIPVIAVVYVIFKLCRHWLTYKLFLPRMIGGIFLGYIPFIMTDEIWAWLLSFRLSHVITVAALSALLSFAYLFLEVYNITHNFRLSLGRSLRVGFIGLTESLLIGLVLCELFANTRMLNLDIDSVTGIKDHSINPVLGLVGLYVPEALLCYFPLALLIGIFLQIFWEDKPITHPI